jgi:hypothetical protein
MGTTELQVQDRAQAQAIAEAAAAKEASKLQVLIACPLRLSVWLARAGAG